MAADCVTVTTMYCSDNDRIQCHSKQFTVTIPQIPDGVFVKNMECTMKFVNSMYDDTTQLKYRTPPSTPFQPGFYRTPQDKLDERKYRLPSQARQQQSSVSFVRTS